MASGKMLTSGTRGDSKAVNSESFRSMPVSASTNVTDKRGDLHQHTVISTTFY